MTAVWRSLRSAYAASARLFFWRLSLKALAAVIFMLVLACSSGLAGEPAPSILIGDFESGDLAGWKEKSFQGATKYEISSDGTRTALRAYSHGSASYLIKKVSVDLSKFPVLNWSWRTDSLLDGLDERTRKGDDYPTRIYVVFSGGTLFWRTRALNYVWSSSQPRGTIWPSAFSDNSMMIAVRSREDGTGRWYKERRNVLEDYRMAFNGAPPRVSAVAIMSDTDQSGQEAVAWFGDVFFTER